MDVVRKLIMDRLDELGLKMSEASVKIGRNHAYLQQFLRRGVPAQLHERDRAELAVLLKIPEDRLRGTSPRLPKRDSPSEAFSTSATLPPHAARDKDRNTPRHLAAADLFGNVDLPVFGTVQAGGGALLTVTSRAVDWVSRPSVLLKTQDGYGLIVAGDSMHPAHRPGSTALVNPHLPPRVEDTCVFRNETNGAIVKEYRGETDSLWKVRQYNPPKDFTLKKSDWPICHVTVGSYFVR